MPNRILKESICISENIDQLTAFQETFFYRLMVNCDDFGRMDARPKILASRLFPLKDMRSGQIEDALRALTSAELVSLYEVGGKPFLQMNTWDRHQQIRAKKSKYPSFDGVVDTPESGCGASDINCNQAISDDIKCSRNPIQSLSESESVSVSESNARDDDAQRIQREHDSILGAAESAGFPSNDSTRAKILDLYAEYGRERLLDAIDDCVIHSVSSLAYLKKVLENQGKPKPQKQEKKTVVGQQYEQRDYSEQEEDADAMLAKLRRYACE